MKFRIVFSLIFLNLSINLSAQQPKEYSLSLEKFKSCWTLKDMVYMSSGGRYTVEDVNNMKGDVICFDNDTINILDNLISNLSYSSTKENTEKFTVRNFQVFTDIYRLFHIKAPYLQIINLNGLNLNIDSLGNPIQFNTSYEFGYDGKYLYFPLNGSLFRFENKQ